MPFFHSSVLSGQEKARPRAASGDAWCICACIAAGALGLFIGQPNPLFHLPVLALAFPFALYLLAALAPTAKRAFFRCWLLGLTGNAAGLYWLINPMHDVGGLGYELTWIGVLLASAYLACYPALAGLGMRRLRWLFSLAGPGNSHRENDSPSASVPGASPAFSLLTRVVPAALLAGCTYAGFEVLCGALFTGFPWLSLASAFSLWPSWVQAASLVGGYGLSACFASVACLGASALLAPSRSERLAAAALALALTAALPGYGSFRLAQPLPEPASPPLSLIMVQGNIDQNQKWEPQFQEATITHYLNMSLRALGDLRAAHPEITPDLVLWPETAMPFYFQAHPEYVGRLRRFAAEHNVNLAFGALGVDRDTRDAKAVNQLYNRLYLISANGGVSGIYDKEHLVPFGEYIPFASSLEFLRNISQGLDFSSGTNTRPLPLARPQARPDPLADAPSPLPAGSEPQVSTPQASLSEQQIPLGVLICYEAIFPSLAQKRVENGVTALVNVSNDGWFGKTSAPLQHLGLTAMRAVEQARPIARATNTGYTALIDSRGRIEKRGERLFVDDTLFASMRPSSELTVYHRIHPMPEVLLVALALFSIVSYTLRRLRVRP